MPGVLPMVAALARRGLRRVVVAAAAVDEARLVDGVEVCGVETLEAAVDVVRARRRARASVLPPRIELVDGPRGEGRTPSPGSVRPGARCPTSTRSVGSYRRAADSRWPLPGDTACC